MPTCCTNLRIFEGRQEVREKGLWVEDIVIGKDSDSCSNLLQALDHLKPLVGFGRT